MRSVTMRERAVPVTQSADVVVVGGGIAGISAALASARRGAKTILIERAFALGGLATLGLITHYLPLCDGRGRQVSFGIAEELLRLSIEHGAEANYPVKWLDGQDIRARASGQRFSVQYNAVLLALAAERILLDAGVGILYGTTLCDIPAQNEALRAVIVQNKTGYMAIEANAFVDASGDADLAQLSGEDTRLFAQGNILAAWYYSVGAQGLTLNQLGASDIPDEYKKRDETPLLSPRRFSGLDGAELSEMVCLSHETLFNDLIARKKQAPETLPASMATLPQVRMTRCLAGAYTLDDKAPHRHCPSSIGMIGDWRTRGPVYELPFEIVRATRHTNLYVAGRCVSVTDSMWDITRVIPACAITGQAAGTAAAMFGMGEAQRTPLQDALRQSGVILHEDELCPIDP